MGVGNLAAGQPHALQRLLDTWVFLMDYFDVLGGYIIQRGPWETEPLELRRRLAI